MEKNGQLLFKSGGYRQLKSFQLAQLCFDITVRFVELYIPPKSRTTDQMVQAARSGVQNIAEGSVASATSKRTELKLTNVARASLEELRLDDEDYLRQHSITVWSKDHLLAQEFIRRRISSMDDFRVFIQWAMQQPLSVNVRTCPLQSVIAANDLRLKLCPDKPVGSKRCLAGLTNHNLCDMFHTLIDLFINTCLSFTKFGTLTIF